MLGLRLNNYKSKIVYHTPNFSQLLPRSFHKFFMVVVSGAQTLATLHSSCSFFFSFLCLAPSCYLAVVVVSDLTEMNFRTL